MNSKENTEYLVAKIKEGNYKTFKKTAPILVREVDKDYNNVCSFGDFVETSRKKQEGEILCKNMLGSQETWFSDKEKLYIKTTLKENILIDGEMWELRIPNEHKLNYIGAFQYNGEMGDNLTFFKPLYDNEMAIQKGSWLAFNLENDQDIWAIERNAMNELYIEESIKTKKIKP